MLDIKKCKYWRISWDEWRLEIVCKDRYSKKSRLETLLHYLTKFYTERVVKDLVKSWDGRGLQN